MTCHNCQNAAQKHGKDRKGHQRYRCETCNKTFLESYDRPLDEMRIPIDKAVFALNCIVEGCSIRTTERLTGLHRDTIMDLLVLAGERCLKLMDSTIQAIPVKRVQADEIWGYVGKKEKRKKPTDSEKLGDAYTFVGIEAQTKLILCFELGRRDFITTIRFIKKLQRSTSGAFPANN
jgi:transposase-like protein